MVNSCSEPQYLIVKILYWLHYWVVLDKNTN